MEYRMSQVTIVHQGFVIPKKKCVFKTLIKPQTSYEFISYLLKKVQKKCPYIKEYLVIWLLPIHLILVNRHLRSH
jgi:hypothetical protein